MSIHNSDGGQLKFVFQVPLSIDDLSLKQGVLRDREPRASPESREEESRGQAASYFGNIPLDRELEQQEDHETEGSRFRVEFVVERLT